MVWFLIWTVFVPVQQFFSLTGWQGMNLESLKWLINIRKSEILRPNEILKSNTGIQLEIKTALKMISHHLPDFYPTGWLKISVSYRLSTFLWFQIIKQVPGITRNHKRPHLAILMAKGQQKKKTRLRFSLKVTPKPVICKVSYNPVRNTGSMYVVNRMVLL